MGLAVFVLERVEFPRPSCGVGFAVGTNVVSGFKLGFQLGLSFGSAVVFCHICIGIGKDFGVVLLFRGLVLLVGFLPVTVELLAVSNVEIAFVLLLEFSTRKVGCLGRRIVNLYEYILDKDT